MGMEKSDKQILGAVLLVFSVFLILAAIEVYNAIFKRAPPPGAPKLKRLVLPKERNLVDGERHTPTLIEGANIMNKFKKDKKVDTSNLKSVDELKNLKKLSDKNYVHNYSNISMDEINSKDIFDESSLGYSNINELNNPIMSKIKLNNSESGQFTNIWQMPPQLITTDNVNESSDSNLEAVLVWADWCGYSKQAIKAWKNLEPKYHNKQLDSVNIKMKDLEQTRDSEHIGKGKKYNPTGFPHIFVTGNINNQNVKEEFNAVDEGGITTKLKNIINK